MQTRDEPSQPSIEKTDELVVPVVESVELGRRVVETGSGVRISKRVTEREDQIDQPLMHEDVRIERVLIDMLVTGPTPTQHYEGQTLVIPVLEEVVVLEKRVRLKEEIRVTRYSRQEQSAERVKLKSEEVSVERFDDRTQGGRHG